MSNHYAVTTKEKCIDLPFDQDKHAVVIAQGFNSPFSHNSSSVIDLSYSVDFALPIDTPVTAVQDGIVRRVMKYTDCYRGFDPQKARNNWATSIEITSPDDDKIFAMLQHLNPDSIQVTKGQEITRGQLLAATGLTGWVGPIPHLHLSMVDSTKRPLTTVPFRFRNYQGSLNDSDVEDQLNPAVWPGMQRNELFISILEAREEAGRIMPTFR